MFNSKGEVVGIISSILTQSGGFEGIGFAISSNVAKTAVFDNPMFWPGFEGICRAGRIGQGAPSGLQLRHAGAESIERIQR